MRRAAFLLLALVPLVPLAPTTGADAPPADDAPVAYIGARILTAEGPVIEKGVLVVQKGKILTVGAGPAIPDDAKVVDLTGKTIIPGLVDTHSHIGVYSRPSVQANSDGNEGSGAVQSGVRALDSIYPDDPGIRMAADAIAAAKVPVVVHPTMQRAASSMETLNGQLCNAAVLADHKVPLAIGTGFEGYVPKTRIVRYEAAMAMVNGLGRERALAAVTLDAARILGVDDKVGSIEPGKLADLVLYDGDPFEHSTHVTYTIQEGRVVWDRDEYLKLPFARRALPLTTGGGVRCCMGQW